MSTGHSYPSRRGPEYAGKLIHRGFKMFQFFHRNYLDKGKIEESGLLDEAGSLGFVSPHCRHKPQPAAWVYSKWGEGEEEGL